jgi:riboflavin biosynthesis pyrimidine reductase
MKKLGEFSNPLIPLEEIQDFYGFQDIPTNSNRIYCWSNSLITIDGMLHFLESSKNVGEIAMQHVKEADPHQEADWRLLNGSRAFADAVLLTGQILRDESDADCSVKYADLIEYRLQVLKKSSAHPVQCILSESGDFPLDRPLFHKPEMQVWIFTSEKGKKRLEEQKQAIDANDWSDVSFFVVQADSAIPDMLQILERAQVKYLDVSCGGRVIRKFLDLGLLDEIRMTMAGHIIGPFNSAGVTRPSLFPKSDSVKSYTPENAPLVAWKGLRTSGDYFVFYRGMVQYR